MQLSRFGLRTGALAAAVAVTAAVSAATAMAREQYPALDNLAQGIAASVPNPAASPPGVNVDGCTPSAEHPRPVVLVNGTFANTIDDWGGLGPTLANEGYCVYGTAIGAPAGHVVQTVGPVRDSAGQVAEFVDSVLAETGASSVDLVGHSQGGLIAEYYTAKLSGASKVHNLVGLSPSTHGTTLNGLYKLAEAFPGGRDIVDTACHACADQLKGSELIDDLGSSPIAQPGVDYTVVETRNEYVVTPAGSAFVDEPGVDNLWVQDFCATDPVDHANLTYSHTVYGLVGNALDPEHAQPVGC